MQHVFMQQEDSQRMLADIADSGGAEGPRTFPGQTQQQHGKREHHHRSGSAVQEKPEKIAILADAHEAKLQCVATQDRKSVV